MNRLASIEKAGFYPTPPSVFQRIATHAKRSNSGGRLLDPCCGTGEPAAHLAKAWNLEAYGIEIDESRAPLLPERAAWPGRGSEEPLPDAKGTHAWKVDPTNDDWLALISERLRGKILPT